MSLECIYLKPKTITERNLDQHLRQFLIDIGVTNLFTITDDAALLAKAKAWILDGRRLKSLNQRFNKTLALLKARLTIGQKPTDKKPKTSKRIRRICQKRDLRIKDFWHCISRWTTNRAVENGVKRVCIGYRKGWKQSVNLGKRNNQNFVYIPFRRLLDMLTYKLEEAGIEVVEHEESYTSKTDNPAGEPMHHIEPSLRLGRRVKRGLFKSSTGVLINADVNGGVGIGRKCNGDAWNQKFWLVNKGVPPTPVRIFPWAKPAKVAASTEPHKSRRVTVISCSK